jgi:competence protein ComFC
VLSWAISLAHPFVMIGRMIFATRCAGCDRPGAPICRTCRLALVSRADTGAPPGVVVAAPFSGRVRDVVLGFKYRNRRAVAGHLAGLLVNRLVAAGHRVDLVTWAPTSARRRRERGFDQAELVARQVARQLGVPCRRLLERGGSGAPQTGRDRIDRLRGPSFRTHPRVPPACVLVVDDVVTTGATLAAAASALRRAGATEVVPAAFAATPDGGAAVGRAA